MKKEEEKPAQRSRFFGKNDMADSDNNERVGRVPPPGIPVTRPAGGVHVDDDASRNAGLGEHHTAAYNKPRVADVVPVPPPDEPPPRRLRRLHRVWPDRDGNISYLLTLCVEGRARVLNNEDTFQRLTAFLLDSPVRYQWCPRRFVLMPDHLHLIAHQGHDAVRLGQWVKALKAVVGGLERRVGCAKERPVGTVERPVGAPGLQHVVPVATVDVQQPGLGNPAYTTGHDFTRLNRSWRWQDGFHDHKFRTPESEQRKWEYVCLNPVRYGLVDRPEQWPFGGEIFYDEADGPRLVRGTPPLLEAGILIEAGETPGSERPPGGGTRPTTARSVYL